MARAEHRRAKLVGEKLLLEVTLAAANA